MTCGAFGVAMLGRAGISQSRRDRIAALEDHQAEAELRAAADERLHIAREVHDVVAHSLGVITVQASVGLQVIDRDPDGAKQALADIYTWSSEVDVEQGTNHCRREPKPSR